MSSQTIRTNEAEDTFTSGQLGLDHPSSRWNTSICSWLCDWLSNKPSSNGSRSSCRRAIADVMEPSRRTVSEFVACIRRATRDGRQRPPPASRAALCWVVFHFFYMNRGAPSRNPASAVYCNFQTRGYACSRVY